MGWRAHRGARRCLSLARSPEELSFEEGEILYVTDDAKFKDWYLATTNKNRTGGLIPKNYGKRVVPLPFCTLLGLMFS